jgi:hypothetical protein
MLSAKSNIGIRKLNISLVSMKRATASAVGHCVHLPSAAIVRG